MGKRTGKKRNKKVLMIVIIVIAVLLLGGLAMMGKAWGIGPFHFLQSWESDVAAIEEKYDDGTETDGLIIFYGASNFARWTEMEEDLSDYKVQNHAFGGSTDTDLVEYADRLLYPYSPDIVFFQTGSNDYINISGTDEEKVTKCMEYKKEMFETFHAQMPDAQFVVMSGLLLPGRSQYLELTLMINEALEEYCSEIDYLHFVDANDMTYQDGVFDESLFVNDGIHLNHEGQLLWMNSYIIPELEALIEEYGLDSVRQ